MRLWLVLRLPRGALVVRCEVVRVLSPLGGWAG